MHHATNFQLLFEASAQGDSFTKGMNLGNHFPKVQDFSTRYGGRRVDPASQRAVRVGFVDAEGTGGRTDRTTR